MNFAGNDCSYLPKKKIEKLRKKIKKTDSFRKGKSTTEDVKVSSSKNINQVTRGTSEKRSPSRSRSNSFEKNYDVELDEVYSDQDERETEYSSNAFTNLGTNSVRNFDKK